MNKTQAQMLMLLLHWTNCLAASVLKPRRLLPDPTLLLIVQIHTAGAHNLTTSYEFEIHSPGSKALKDLNVVFNVFHSYKRKIRSAPEGSTKRINRILKVEAKTEARFGSAIQFSSLRRFFISFCQFFAVL